MADDKLIDAPTAPARPKAMLPTLTDESEDAAGAATIDARASGGAHIAKPDKLGRFTILDKLGEGGMGIVVSAYDPELDRRVAIKVLRAESKSRASDRLVREAKAMAKLHHPNVITVFDVGTVDEQVYIAMEYATGGTLEEWLVPERSVEEIVDMFIEAGRGLAAAHEVGIVHRDFKPENVLINAHGQPLVADFGIAGWGELPAWTESGDDGEDGELESVSLTRTGAVLGTPLFMAPEQHLGQRANPRSDQYAFCVSLWRALHRTRPFNAESMAMLVLAKNERDLVSTRPAGEIPDAIRAALSRGLSPDAADRFGSMEELLDALEIEPPVRRPLWWFGALAVVGVAAAVVVMTLFGSKQSQAERDRAAAERAARACNCLLATIEVPATAELVAVRTLAGEAVDVDSIRQGTGQFLFAPGQYLIEYGAGERTTSYGLRSDGFAQPRLIELPPIVDRDGYRFVAGGDIVVGGARLPEANHYLEPYLISTSEHVRSAGDFAAPNLFSFDEARETAREQGARLPTAAEWEWAARLAVGEGYLEEGYEWTATQFRPYPYRDDGRDNPLASLATAELRGGGDKLDVRSEGNRLGGAELRLVRDATNPEAPHDLVLEARALEDELSVIEREKLAIFVSKVARLPGRVAVFHDAEGCAAHALELGSLGIDKLLEREGEESKSDSCVISVGALPPEPPGRGPVVVTTTKIERLDETRWEAGKVAPTAGSHPILRAVASTITGNDLKVEVVPYVAIKSTTDPIGLTHKRAKWIRDFLIKEGVAADRVSARAGGDRKALACTVNPPAATRTPEQARELLFATHTTRLCGEGDAFEIVRFDHVEFLNVN